MTTAGHWRRMKLSLVLAASALVLAACDSHLPPSQDAPNPDASSGADDAPRPARAEAPPPDTPPAQQSPPRQVDASATQCVQGETHLYSCPMGGGRTVSVCVGNRQVSYRYGPQGDPEIDLTVPAGRPGLWAGGQSQPHLRFRSGAYDYVVYSGRQPDGVERSGVLVLRGGDEIRRLACPVTSSQTEIPAGMVPDYVPRESPDARADDWF